MSLKSGMSFPRHYNRLKSYRKHCSRIFVFFTDAFPSSAAFDAINSALTSDDAERKDAIKKGKAVFAFTLKNSSGKTQSWHIDLKDKGVVGKGEAPSGGKADGTSLRTRLFGLLGLIPICTYYVRAPRRSKAFG